MIAFLCLSRHGTRCAGEVAAVANNSHCIVGIAYNARIGGMHLSKNSLFTSLLFLFSNKSQMLFRLQTRHSRHSTHTWIGKTDQLPQVAKP